MDSAHDIIGLGGEEPEHKVLHRAFVLTTPIGKLIKLGEVNASFAGKLTKQLMRICRKQTGHTFYDLDNPVRKALGELAVIHPQEVWNEVAAKLLSKKWDVRFYAESLLANRHSSEDHLTRGIAFPVPADVILRWVRDDPATRARLAVAWLPVATKNDDGSLQWHPELESFIDEFAVIPQVLGALAMRFRPSSWWGSLAPYLEPIIPLLDKWRTHPSEDVRSWAAQQIDYLKREIADAHKRSEEDVVRYS